MSELFESGRIVDLIIGLMLVETVVLFAYLRRTGRIVARGSIVSNLLAGVFLLLALRLALVAASWGWIALCLAAALFAHIADLGRRLRSTAPLQIRTEPL